MNKRHISLLLGSGFSVPNGYPTTSQINQRLKKIEQDEIHIHSSGSAWFLDGRIDLNSWSRSEEKLFVEKFLTFYNSEILNGQEFNYEIFYDFYNELRRTDNLDNKCQAFFERFKIESGQEWDHYNLLMNFHSTFSQLLASRLSIKWPEPVTFLRPYEKNYAEFLELIDELGQTFKVHIHTLNHDLLMERFAHTETLGNKISDGFEELGSPFYGQHILYIKNKNDKDEKPMANYTVRLRRFTNEFSRNFCLYKLHGSVDQYVFNYENKEYSTIKLLYGISPHELFKETMINDDKAEYSRGHTEVYPDFLSGTSTKIMNYDRQVYYKPIFDHFVDNLRNSQILIIVGYGFQDPKINEFIQTEFIDKNGTKIIDIDIQKPDISMFDEKYFEFFLDGISNINHYEVLKYCI